MNRHNNLFIIPSIIILGLVALLPAKTVPYENRAGVVNPVAPQRVLISQPSIEAKSALVVDFETGKYIFEKNAQEPLPLASLTKIVSALTLLDFISLDEIVPITASAIATEGGSSLIKGEHISVHDLLTMTMVESSNDALAALVEYTAHKKSISPEYTNQWFIDAMQKKAASLGASHMTFQNPIGLDISPTEAGATGSAEDIMQIAQQSYASDIWRFVSNQNVISKEGKIHILHPTNNIEGDIPQLMGSKTGFTDVAGGNLIILFENPIRHPIGIVVLKSSSEGRFDDVKKLYTYTSSVVQ